MDVTFDCSNVEIAGVIEGPKVDNCVGLGMLLSLDGAPNSVAAFGIPTGST